MTVNEKNIILQSEDIEIYFRDIEGWQVAQGYGITVALDMTLSETLIQEGMARELINRIQNIRKDKGLEITDRIAVSLKHDPILAPAVLENEAYILSEILGAHIVFKPHVKAGIPLEFYAVKTEINIKKMA